MNGFKTPVSVLVVIHTPALEILLLERALHRGYWQSVTGSREGTESLLETARREVAEETGIAAGADAFCDWQSSTRYEIYPEGRHRYAPGVVENTEHVFSLEVPANTPVTLAPDEHLDYCWLPWQDAARKCFSSSNREAILMLPERVVNRPR